MELVLSSVVAHTYGSNLCTEVCYTLILLPFHSQLKMHLFAQAFGRKWGLAPDALFSEFSIHQPLWRMIINGFKYWFALFHMCGILEMLLF